MAEESAKRRSNPVVTFLAVVGTLTLTTVVLFLVAIFWIVSQFSQNLQFTTGTSLGSFGGDHIALIKLEGPIDSTTADSIMKRVDHVLESDSAKGLFLEVNSPGGAVVASQEIYDKILEARKKMPVMAYARDVIASGSYYAAAPSTWIVANRSSMVGSIGVIMTQMGAKELLNWAKINPIVIKTGELKDAGSPFRDLTPQDESYLQELLNENHQVFITDVIEGRGAQKRQADWSAVQTALKLPGQEETAADPSGSEEENPGAEGGPQTTTPAAFAIRDFTLASMEHMKDGRVVLGQEALTLGMVDAIATRTQALNALRTALGNPDLEEVEIRAQEDIDSLMERYLDRIHMWANKVAQDRALQTPRIEAR